MRKRSVLITGATGILGGWVTGEALRRGYDVTVLMRDARPYAARERLASVLRLVGQESHAGEVRILQGDTRQPALGLGPRQRGGAYAGLGALIHCAACTSFDAGKDDELWQTNVEGIKNVIDFAAEDGIPLYHVSTAYVAGDRAGRVLETELNCGQRFNNTYERTKYESEHLVNAAIAENRIRGAIFRPSIIVGATVEGRISQFLNFYSYLRFIDLASAHELSSLRRLRIQANPDATKNLVPVDWTAQALWHIMEADGPSGRTYHLTSPRPAVLRDVADWANQILGPHRLRLEIVPQFDERASVLEKALNASFRYYRPYTRHEPMFDRAHTARALGTAVPFPEMGPLHYGKMLEFARRQRWQGIFGCHPDSSQAAYETRITRFFPRVAPGNLEPELASVGVAAERRAACR